MISMFLIKIEIENKLNWHGEFILWFISEVTVECKIGVSLPYFFLSLSLSFSLSLSLKEATWSDDWASRYLDPLSVV